MQIFQFRSLRRHDFQTIPRYLRARRSKACTIHINRNSDASNNVRRSVLNLSTAANDLHDFWVPAAKSLDITASNTVNHRSSNVEVEKNEKAVHKSFPICLRFPAHWFGPITQASTPTGLFNWLLYRETLSVFVHPHLPTLARICTSTECYRTSKWP